MRTLWRILLVLGCLFVVVAVLSGIIYRDRRPRIYYATEEGNTNAIAHYLGLGSNVNALIGCYPFHDRPKATLLDIAVENGQLETVEFLLEKGADPNQPDWQGHTPLIWAIGRTKNGVPQERSLRIFKSLLGAGADPNLHAPSGYRYTPLLEAASIGETDKAKVLLGAGSDVNATNSIGQTALHLAHDHPETIELLLKAGANRFARDAYGDSPVDYAIRDGYTNSLFLLTNGGFQTNTNR